MQAHVRAAIKSGHVPKIRDWRNLPVEKMTLGEKVCAFVEAHVIVPEGSLVGQKVVLDEFQTAFILAVYDNPKKTRVAILSIARKNAKTALIAFLVLAHLVGPVAKLNSRLNSGAMSRTQAAEVFNYASKAARMSPTLQGLIHTTKSQKEITGLTLETEYRALSADAENNQGLSPIVAIIDEAGQIKGAQSDFVDAISTAQAAHSDPLMFYISTQAPTDADFLSVLIDDAIINQPADVVCHLYAADPDCDILDEAQWLKANPALGKFRSLEEMRAQAEKAQRMPSFRNTFRNLLLNQRVASFATFIDPEEWKQNDGKPLPLVECDAIYGGLDLSSKNDLTAFVLVGMKGKTASVYAKFWTPRQGLRDRQDTDRAPYDVWESEGFLTVIEGATVDYEQVVMDLATWFDDLGIQPDAIAFDRWRIDEFRRQMQKIGVDLPLVEFGQGFRDMAPALDALEDAVLERNLHHGSNPVMNMCAINAVAVTDPANNRKLEKRKATGRIDGMVALTMALGVKSKEVAEAEQDLSDFFNAPIIA